MPRVTTTAIRDLVTALGCVEDVDSIVDYLYGTLSDDDTAAALTPTDLASMLEALVSLDAAADATAPAPSSEALTDLAKSLLALVTPPPSAASPPADGGSTTATASTPAVVAAPVKAAAGPSSRRQARRNRRAGKPSGTPAGAGGGVGHGTGVAAADTAAVPSATPASAAPAPPTPTAAATATDAAAPSAAGTAASAAAETAATSEPKTIAQVVEAGLTDLDEVDDWTSAWEEVKAKGVTWGGPGFGGRATNRVTQRAAGKDVVVDGVTMAFSGHELLQRSQLRFHHGRRYVIVGKNGVGKTTLLRRMARCSIPGFPLHLRVGYVAQEVEAVPGVTGADFLVRALRDYEAEPATTLRVPPSVLAAATAAATAAVTTAATSGAAAGAGAGTDSGDDEGTDGDGVDPYRAALEAEQETLEAALAEGGDGADAITERLCAIYEELEALADTDGDGDDSTGSDGSDSSREDSEAGRLRHQVVALLKKMGFSKALRDTAMEELSGGWRARLALAAALLGRPDVLLLDEPTNHLDLHGVLWLQNFLSGRGLRNTGCHTLVFVSHDRAFTNAVATDVVEMKDKQLRYFPGTLAEFEQRESEKLSRHSRMLDARARKEKKAMAFISSSRTAGKTSTGKKKKFVDEKRQKQAKQASRKLERLSFFRTDGKRFQTKAAKKLDADALRLPERLEYLRTERTLRFLLRGPTDTAVAMRSVTSDDVPVLRLTEASVGYNDALPPVLSDVSLEVTLKSRVAVVGANGSGKSTLLKLLLGELPTRGAEGVWTHHGLRVAHVAQHHIDALQGFATISASKYLADRFRVTEEEARGPLGCCGMPAELALRPIGSLSGGQKARVAFTAATWTRPHLLVLDEPTNHLDVDSLQALAVGLQSFSGAVVLVSHDQSFMRSLCNELWTVEDAKVAASGYLGGDGTLDDNAFPAALAEYAARVTRSFNKKRRE